MSYADHELRAGCPVRVAENWGAQTAQVKISVDLIVPNRDKLITIKAPPPIRIKIFV